MEVRVKSRENMKHTKGMRATVKQRQKKRKKGAVKI